MLCAGSRGSARAHRSRDKHQLYPFCMSQRSTRIPHIAFVELSSKAWAGLARSAAKLKATGGRSSGRSNPGRRESIDNPIPITQLNGGRGFWARSPLTAQYYSSPPASGSESRGSASSASTECPCSRRGFPISELALVVQLDSAALSGPSGSASLPASGSSRFHHSYSHPSSVAP
jgi:hypothetical protein